MSREHEVGRTKQALADIERIAGTARNHFEKEEWSELCTMFDHIGRLGHQGFNLSYNLAYKTEPAKPGEAPGEASKIIE